MSKIVRKQDANSRDMSTLGIPAEDEFIGSKFEEIFKEAPGEFKWVDLKNGTKVLMLTEESFEGLCKLMQDDTLKQELEKCPDLVLIPPVADENV